MTELEEILIVLLQDNGMPKRSKVGITKMLRTPYQQAVMIEYLIKNKNQTSDQIIKKALEIFKEK